MTDSASEPRDKAERLPDVPFVEDDASQTLLPYDNGGVPLYIALAWVTFIVTYIVVVFLVVIPDLRAWLGH